MNQGVGRITGFLREELLGKRLSDLSSGEPPFGRTEADLLLKRVQTGEDLLVEWQARHKAGHLFWVEISLKRVTLEGEDRILACARDITGRKKAEAELVQIREALDDSSDAVIAVDRHGKATYINVAFGTTFGFTREQEEAIELAGLFADGETGLQVVTTVLGGAGWEGETEMVSKEGRRFPASVRATPVMDDDFEVIAALFILDDITERRQLESQLVQSQNLKSIGQLAAGIAHEMNTPLQYVGDNVRFLRDSFQELLEAMRKVEEHLGGIEEGSAESAAAGIREALAEADLEYLTEEVPLAIDQSLEGTERVTQIVRAMRQFTHPGTKAKQLVDLNQALQSTITVARNEWRYVAELETDFTEGLTAVPCMPGEFNQVILNLIINASHAIADVVGDGAERKGTITVSTAQVDEFAEVRISDTGTGIPEEAQNHIFDPFFTTKDVGKGTGQGLAISRSVIVDKHGGTLDFETAPGQGTTFIIRLPLQADEMGEEEEAPA
jgi:PAS domain S-box-containing protein